MSDESRDRHDRLTVAEAAKVLGISEGAVRKRVERGKLQAGHTPDGRLIVYLDSSTFAYRDHVHDQSHDTATVAAEHYVRSLEDQVEYLRRQLDHERDANRENRRIIAALTSRIPELEPPSSEVPSQEPSESPETAESPGPRERPFTDEESTQEAAQPRSWWRRVFGVQRGRGA